MRLVFLFAHRHEQRGGGVGERVLRHTRTCCATHLSRLFVRFCHFQMLLHGLTGDAQASASLLRHILYIVSSKH